MASPRDRPRSEFSIIEALEKSTDVVVVHSRKGFSQVVKKSREFRKVAAITFDAIRRQAFFNSRKVKKQNNFLIEGRG